jgi:hypothetical protein
VLREDGLFDLLSTGTGTAYGASELVYRENVGSAGAPMFNTAEPLLLGGKTLTESLGNHTFKFFTYGDVDGDGANDLLIVAGSGLNESYWPDGISMWKGEYYNSGPARGYDVAGNWLGRPTRVQLFWAMGSLAEGKPVFAELQSVYYCLQGTPVQWESFSEVAPAVLHVQEDRYVVLCGNVNQLLALKINLSGNDIICEKSQPLLKDGVGVENGYAYTYICVNDFDSDGAEEVLISGTPGRIAYIKGNAVGEFEEIGPLYSRGGDVSVDTLAVPCRIRYDHDEFEDLIVGDASGRLSFWPGTEDPLVYGAPVFFRSGGEQIRHLGGLTGSIQGPQESCWGYTNPTAADWDGDGVIDIIVGDINGDLTLYQQENGLFDLTGRVFVADGKPLAVASRVRPAVLETEEGSKLLIMDFDGDLALLTPEEPGAINAVSVTKLLNTKGQPIHPCGASGLWGRTKLAVTDFDGDGVWDIVLGTHRQLFQFFLSPDELKKVSGASLAWLRNSGTADNPVFEEPKVILLEDGSSLNFDVHCASVSPTDFNEDDLVDFIVGAENGKIYSFVGVKASVGSDVRLRSLSDSESGLQISIIGQ